MVGLRSREVSGRLDSMLPLSPYSSSDFGCDDGLYPGHDRLGSGRLGGGWLGGGRPRGAPGRHRRRQREAPEQARVACGGSLLPVEERLLLLPHAGVVHVWVKTRVLRVRVQVAVVTVGVEGRRTAAASPA